MLEDMKELGFGMATRAGISLGIEDLCVPESKAPIVDGTRQRTAEAELRCENGDITVVEKFLKVTGEWTKASEEVKDAATANFRDNMPTNPVYMMSTSGARGSISQVRQLIAMRGLMADANGELIEVPISNSLRDGMTVTDMLISGHGARKGVIDTALRTADSGYLYRRLDFAVSNLAIRAEDCKTQEADEHGLDWIFKPWASLQDRIRGRVLASDILDPESGKVLHERGHLLTIWDAKVIAKRWEECRKAGVPDLPPIRVRSPLTCRLQDGLCSKCYGEDLSNPGRTAKIGTPVGTIAAQSMGEPGTQLTMRTFHTGGAFEGGAGRGIFAACAGQVRLISKEGTPITPPTGSLDDGEGEEVGEWVRTPQGEVACLLSCKAELQVLAQGEKKQSEDLEPDTLVRVHDGQAVSRGQSLFETDARQLVEALKAGGDDPNIKKLPKPIVADESGEVLITDASSRKNCLPAGARLVWVLQGSCASFENQARSSVSVREGDAVAAGMPLATEWAVTRCPGVQRFQIAPKGALARSGAESAPAAGWRRLDWPHLAADDELEEEEEEAETEEAAGGDLPKGELCLRTDFDWFFLEGALAEYRASCHLPEALRPHQVVMRTLKDEFFKDRAAQMNANMATTEAIDTLKEIKPTVVSVLTFSPQAEQDPGDMAASADEGSLGVVCTAASRGAEGVICPVTRTAHPEHTVPMGGLIFHQPAGFGGQEGGRPLLWVPEESQTLQVTEELFRQLVLDFGQFAQKGAGVPGLGEPLDGRRTYPVLFAGETGYCCFYLPANGRVRRIGTPAALVEEEGGVLRRQGRDRVCCPEQWARYEADPDRKRSSIRTVECVVKPGSAFLCPSKFLDDSWYEDALGERGGLYFHEKLVPPGVPFLPGLPDLVFNDGWRVVELLDDPRAGSVCRVLVRPAFHVDVPDDPELLHPAETRTLTSWHLPFNHGERVRSREPVPLAYEVVSSLGRHPAELHVATPVPVEGESPLRVAAPQPWQATLKSSSSGLSVELARESSNGTVCVVQHSPLGTPESVSGGAWSEAPPKYIAPDQAARLSGAEPAWLPTPRRQLMSEGGGCVCRIDSAASGRSTVVLIGPGDCARVACRGRPTVDAGALLRTGEALSDEDVTPVPGQVLLVEETGAGEDGGPAFQVTLRCARAYLVTGEGEVRVPDDSVVQQGDLIGTENLVVPRTSDITQGLPRINKCFEAAGGTMQARLDELWEEAKRSLTPFEAALHARNRLREEMVSEIQSVYLEQGVFINGRHIETVVAQMTAKCQVISGGMGLPGSNVLYADVEALLAIDPTRDVQVKPLVRGVTSVGKDLHVLVSMAFREVDNIITDAVMHGPAQHKMEGVKENIMMGKPINVGFSTEANGLWSKSAKSSELDMDLEAIPEFSAPVPLGELVE